VCVTFTATPLDPGMQATYSGNINLKLGEGNWTDADTFTKSGRISAIVVRVHTTSCPCTGRRGGCIDGYVQYNIGLEADEVITGVYVGFAKLNFIVTTADGLCYLQFNTTRRSYGPYDAGCRGTVTSYYNLSSGLAYISGIGGWCISG
jgi:hypothetical protein